jgi:hypothetical protein
VRRLEIALQLAWSVCKRVRRIEKVDRLAEALGMRPTLFIHQEEIGSKGWNSCSGPYKISHLASTHKIRKDIKKADGAAFLLVT